MLLGSLSYIMLLAVINGSRGFVCAMGVTVFGTFGVAKALGEAVALSYGWIIGLAVGCGILRGLLRYFEQYSNHYIAFRLLAVLRNKIFGALRVLCPAKLESKQKGSIIAMITSDIETLEVFSVGIGNYFRGLHIELVHRYSRFGRISDDRRFRPARLLGET